MVNFVKDNPCFEINNGKLYCNVCNEIKEYNPSGGIRNLKRHLTSKKHCESYKLSSQQTRLDIKQINSGTDNFHMDLIIAFVTSNIAINKLECSNLRSFIEKYTGVMLFSHTHYRNVIVDRLYNLKCWKLKGN